MNGSGIRSLTALYVAAPLSIGYVDFYTFLMPLYALSLATSPRSGHRHRSGVRLYQCLDFCESRPHTLRPLAAQIDHQTVHAQFGVFGLVTVAKWLARRPDWAFAADRAMRGLGKLCWFGPFKLKLYGQPAATPATPATEPTALPKAARAT